MAVIRHLQLTLTGGKRTPEISFTSPFSFHDADCLSQTTEVAPQPRRKVKLGTAIFPNVV